MAKTPSRSSGKPAPFKGAAQPFTPKGTPGRAPNANGKPPASRARGGRSTGRK